MADTEVVEVPDIGDFQDVEIIEVLVAPGDTVRPEDPLITLESDKATMDVPSPVAGTVESLAVNVGDRVSEGSTIATIVVEAADTATPPPGDKAESESETGTASPPPSAPSAAPAEVQDGDIQADLVVLGSGPGGYTAAFRAADLGLKTVLVERHARLGGVCLNVGCIPSKALLHAAKVIDESREMSTHGISFGPPSIDVDALRGWKDGVVNQLTSGLTGLAKRRKVEVIHGYGEFTGTHQLTVKSDDESRTIHFQQAIIAAGSHVTRIPGIPYDDPRVIDSTGALALSDIPERMLVIGGGIIGLEMATVYLAMGTSICVVEMLDQLIAGADADIVKPLHKQLARHCEIRLGTRVREIQSTPDGLEATFDGDDAPAPEVFDRVLISVGRQPNGHRIGAEHAGVDVGERGFIAVDDQQRTNVPHIYAIGDVVGQPMLAHKAVHEGKVAAEVAAGLKSGFDARVIPSVAYTDPEVAWVGLTETEAKSQKVPYEKGSFPWAASGRSLSLGRNEGITKLLFDPESKRLLGAGVVGTSAGDLIAEAALAIEMGADAEDIGLTIHPHPTLSETIGFAAEAFEGTITDLFMPKRKKR